MERNQLTRDQWSALEAQFNQTPTEPEAEALPGEHLKLIGLLNRFGFYPMSKQEALKLAGDLLDGGWA